VLEHVRETGSTCGTVDTSHPEADPPGHRREVVPGEEQEEHSVVQPEFLHPVENRRTSGPRGCLPFGRGPNPSGHKQTPKQEDAE
jgi:hypothetical protein